MSHRNTFSYPNLFWIFLILAWLFHFRHSYPAGNQKQFYRHHLAQHRQNPTCPCGWWE